MLVRYSYDAKGRRLGRALVYTESEHGIPRQSVDAGAIRVVEALVGAGYETYIVGGAVRDLVAGRTPKDFDIVTGAVPSRIRRLFRNSRIIGRRFRIVHVSCGSQLYEVSTFRSRVGEGSVCVPGTLEEDAWRRDFSVNALYYDPLRNVVIDCVGGMVDLKRRRVRPLIPLRSIFVEDPVRMLRALKCSVMCESSIPFSVRRSIRRSVSLLGGCSPSRLTDEFVKILFSGRSAALVCALCGYQLLLYLQPSVHYFMRDVPCFESAFFASLRVLDQAFVSGRVKRVGQALTYVLRDFVGLVFGHADAPDEVYIRVYRACRSFVLPMNPPRVELEYAVRSCLGGRGFAARAACTPSGRLCARENGVRCVFSSP